MTTAKKRTVISKYP